MWCSGTFGADSTASVALGLEMRNEMIRKLIKQAMRKSRVNTA